MQDCLIIGAGAVGLSLAYELARRQWRVKVLDQNAIGREASWAGAGILPPAKRTTALHPLDQLRGLSNELHAQWAAQLQAETGIDNGYRRCGGIYLARTAGESAALVGWADTLRQDNIACERLTLTQLLELEPALQPFTASTDFKAAYHLPEECQLRNPRHLRALQVACVNRGVEMIEHAEVKSFVTSGDHIQRVSTTQGDFAASYVAMTSGAWTQRLLDPLQIRTGILPIRGQIVLFRCEQPLFRAVLNEGSRYLVSREDGYVLAGSTEEEVGFDKSTTAEGIAALTEYAYALVPALKKATIENSWSGLRPGSFDGFPYLGRLPGYANAFIAAGHFRSGLHLSPATAVSLADLLEGKTPAIDLSLFRVGR
jgi:glycine oxidase